VSEIELVDVAVIGGGPAGLAAAFWAARYRRRVVLFDNGHQRNRWTKATHGYLGLEGIAPSQLVNQARDDLRRYPEIRVHPTTVLRVSREHDAFEVTLDEGETIRALRLILATGVRDRFPPIDRFEEFYGTSVFTCPSCDGYEANNEAVAVLGDAEHTATFAIGLLDWAETVTVIIDPSTASINRDACQRLAATGITVVEGTPQTFTGHDGRLETIILCDGAAVSCRFAFCVVEHEQHSELAAQLGCAISEQACVIIDDECRTSVEHVYAAGDMTPGPHLVQVAASKGAVAGIAAALSLRGEHGAPLSPQPAPEPDAIVGP
jgi:thioredoxin reductase